MTWLFSKTIFLIAYKKIDYKKSQVQLKKKQLTKIVNLGYLNKSVNHANLI